MVRDICQKLVEANGWSLVGFAGNLCIGRHLLRGVVNRIRSTLPDDPSWLRDDEAILRFVHSGVKGHVRLNADHRLCQRETAELLIAWIDYNRSPLGGERSVGGKWFPPRMELVAVHSPAMTIRRTLFGVEAIGSGSIIAEPMRRNSYLDIAWHARDQERGDIGRCFYTASVAKELLVAGGDPMVGGLFQLAVLSHRGAEVVPHFYWVPVGHGYGTYVAMRVKGGEWIQEHRPTGTKTKVMGPFDVHLRGPRWQRSQAFDPAAKLTKDSPGVIAAPGPEVLQFCPYDPDRVHPLIRQSWGLEPLAPLTWAEGPPKRRRP